MVAAEPTTKFGDSPHLIDEEPSSSWSTDDLGAAAATEFAALVTEEKAVTIRYWRMGRLLSLARKPLTHGQWGCFLTQWKIDKTRAAKALRIFKRFTTPEETVGLTVAEACQRNKKPARPGTQRKRPKSAPASETAFPPILVYSWPQFADTVTEMIERQLDEPEFLTPNEAALAVASLDRVLAALQQSAARLRRCVTVDSAS